MSWTGDVYLPNGLSTLFFAFMVILWNIRFGMRLNIVSGCYSLKATWDFPLMYVSHGGRKGQRAVCRVSGSLTPCLPLVCSPHGVGSRSTCLLGFTGLPEFFFCGYSLSLLLFSFFSLPEKLFSRVFKSNDAKERPKTGFYTLAWISCYPQFGMLLSYQKSLAWAPRKLVWH